MPISVGNVLWLDSDNLLVPGPVQVVEVHEHGWKFVAIEGHIAEGGTVEFYIAPGAYAETENVHLTVLATGVEGTLEAANLTLAEASGRFLWSQMAASISCEARRAQNSVVRC